MRLLFIGGTQFVGRAMVEAALRAGHEVTVLHRGQTGGDLFPAARHVLADRNGDLSGLADGEWDATVDVSAYLPAQVRSLAAALDGRGGHYLFVSTVSVYADPAAPGATEDSPLLEPADADVTEVGGETYGPLKVACEQAAAELFATLTIIRPTLVIGPHDPTGRFPWWVLRLARGGEVLVPGPSEAPIQVIDSRDMADWTVGLIERGVTGTFTAARPGTTFGELLATTAAVAGGPGTRLVWADPGFLTAHDVTGRNQPFWTEGETSWTLAMDPAHATENGLRHGPLDETVRDTLTWALAAGADTVLNPAWGLPADREAELLRILAEPQS